MKKAPTTTDNVTTLHKQGLSSSILYTGDNLFVLAGMNSESVDLIYLDPPFNSKRIYSAPRNSKLAGANFKDMWTWHDVNMGYLERLYGDHPEIADFIGTIGKLHSKGMMAYVAFMTQRIFELHRILEPTGSIYLHLDPTASHYLKIILDAIFGKDNFRNEIIWHYGGPSAVTNAWPRKHDIILFYVKRGKYVFSPQYGPLKNYVFDRARQDKDGRLWVDQRLGKLKEETIDTMKQAGLVFTTRAGNLRRKQYLDTMKGQQLDTVWDIPIINSQSKERTGYPTQKPLELLHRIIQASSNEGDTVFDPFCGCATAMVAAQQLNRTWIGIDIEEKAADMVAERLQDDAGLFTNFVHSKEPPVRTDVEDTEPTKLIKDRLYITQEGVCAGCLSKMEARNLEVDHIIPRARGGGDYYENYQLLCGHCNRVKGSRTMEYLLAKVSAIKNNRVNHSYT